MTTYRNIHGRSIQAVSTDPTGDITEGQIWYNTTSDTFKSVLLTEAWSSASSLITARFSLAGAGTQTAALAFGGKEPSVSNKTEEYNGSGWSTGGNLGTAVYILGSAGSQTAGLGFGGYRPGNTNATEEYDGSSWTSGGAMGTARRSLMGAGIQTAALGAGGNATTTNVNITEEYNGSSWTSGGTMGTGRAELGGSGLQTAALAVGAGSPNAQVEEYDGSSWTSGGALNTGRSTATATGPQTANLAFGPSADCEAYDGTSWTAKTDMGTPRGSMGGGMQSPNTASIGFGGSPGAKADTEEYNQSINTITPAAWSAGDNIPTATSSYGGAGTRDATLVFGGYVGGPGVTGYVAETYEYNGSAWSDGGDLSVRRNSPINFGTQTAAVAFAGNNQPPSGGVYLNSGDHYDGSSWTSTPNNYPTNISNSGSVGTQTTGLAFAGYTGTALTNATNEYDGSTWTSSNTYTVSQSGMGVAGIQTSALAFGGTDNGSPFPASGQTTTAEYNGSTWTALTGLPGGRIYPQGAGTTNADNARSIGGRNTSGSSITETLIHDGTAWATQPSLAAARQNAAAGGVYSTSAAATIISGSPLPSSTENFTPETLVVTASTLTSS